MSGAAEPAGARGAPVEDHALLNLTRRCNQRCVFCFEGQDRPWPEMSLDDVRRCLDEVRRRGLRRAVLMGGEALLRPDIAAVARHAASIGLELQAFTNGTPLARAGLVEELVAAGLRSYLISSHYADPESFALGTGVGAKGFDAWRRGLENLGAFVRANPSPDLDINFETVLFRLNLGRLRAIRALIRESAALSRSTHAFKSLQAPAGRVTAQPLLDPIEERRAELLDLLAHERQDDLPIRFVDVPLCYLPGHEHLSVSARNRASSVRIECNFEDKALLASAAQPDVGGAYGWICRRCTLVPLCSGFPASHRTAMLRPSRATRPIPRRDGGLGEILRAMGVPASAEVALENLRTRILAVPAPDAELLEQVVALLELGGAARIVERHAAESPLFDLDVRVGGRLVRVRILLPRPGGAIGFLIGPFNVELDPADGPEARALLERLKPLQASGAPMLARLADMLGPAHHPDAEAAALAISSRFGSRLWPGSPGIAGWTVESGCFLEPEVTAWRARSPTGRTVDLWICATPVPGDPDLSPVSLGGGLSIYMQAPDGEVGDLLEAHRELEGLAGALAEIAGSPGASWSAASAGGALPPAHAAAFEARPGLVRVVFGDRAGHQPECEFLVGEHRPGDRVFRSVGALGIVHRRYPKGPWFDALCRLVVDLVARLPVGHPYDARRVRAGIEAELARLGPLRVRWTITGGEVPPP